MRVNAAMNPQSKEYWEEDTTKPMVVEVSMQCAKCEKLMSWAPKLVYPGDTVTAEFIIGSEGCPFCTAKK